MNISEWKKLEDTERDLIVSDHKIFDAYSDDSYNLVRALGKELASKEAAPVDKVGVLNRWGELHIHHKDSNVLRINNEFKDKNIMVSELCAQTLVNGFSIEL